MSSHNQILYYLVFQRTSIIIPLLLIHKNCFIDDCILDFTNLFLAIFFIFLWRQISPIIPTPWQLEDNINKQTFIIIIIKVGGYDKEILGMFPVRIFNGQDYHPEIRIHFVLLMGITLSLVPCLQVPQFLEYTQQSEARGQTDKGYKKTNRIRISETYYLFLTEPDFLKLQSLQGLTKYGKD